MAFKTIKGVYADRPLLTEDELNLALYALECMPVVDEKMALLREQCKGKLYKSKQRITMLQLNK